MISLQLLDNGNIVKMTSVNTKEVMNSLCVKLREESHQLSATCAAQAAAAGLCLWGAHAPHPCLPRAARALPSALLSRVPGSQLELGAVLGEQTDRI